ncbi:hypothetical protein TPPAVE_171 [Candidatus Tremblaya phenacola PAVE]|nr:hypothetical protein TPPAVE_171 [Candidatus Tremblaya phenacola PAVE]
MISKHKAQTIRMHFKEQNSSLIIKTPKFVTKTTIKTTIIELGMLNTKINSSNNSTKPSKKFYVRLPITPIPTGHQFFQKEKDDNCFL